VIDFATKTYLPLVAGQNSISLLPASKDFSHSEK
jgi:hypothetical protein